MELVFNLTKDESQQLLNALAKEPYGQVVNLIKKILKQKSIKYNIDN